MKGKAPQAMRGEEDINPRQVPRVRTVVNRMIGHPKTFEQQPAGNWRGVFNVQSYTQYFDVDTDVVINRLTSSFSSFNGDFSSKIEANPDLYGPIWIGTTLIFILSALGNCATFLMDKTTDSSTSWSFDVGYITTALWPIYGYVIVVPLGFYFFLKYMGSNASLIQFWCMWGYSLFIFIPVSCFLLIPVEIIRWIIIVLVGGASAGFVSTNLRSHAEPNVLFIVVAAAFLLQMALAILIKVLHSGELTLLSCGGDKIARFMSLKLRPHEFVTCLRNYFG